MRIRSDIARRFWHEAAVADLASKYAEQGYEVKKDARIGNNKADLVLKKGDELIVVEVKSGDWPKEKTAQVQSIRNEVVHKLGGKFNLVLISPPRDKSIEVEGVDQILFDRLSEDIGDLDQLSTHTVIEDISDVEVDSVSIERNRIQIQGSAVVSVELNWGSPSDAEKGDGDSLTESFPLAFDIALDGNLKVIEIIKLDVDISSYYE